MGALLTGTALALATAVRPAHPATVQQSAIGRATGLDRRVKIHDQGPRTATRLDRGGSMHEYDKSSKWLIQHHGDSILRLAGVRDIVSWQPLPAELVQSRRLPDGLIEVRLHGQVEPDLYVLEIATYPEARVADQVSARRGSHDPDEAQHSARVSRPLLSTSWIGITHRADTS